MTQSDYIVPVESSNLYYHQFQIFSLLFGIGFFISGLHLTFVEGAVITVNGVRQDGNFWNALPFTIIGLGSLIAFAYYTRNHSKARVSNKGVTIKNRDKTHISWEDIDCVELKRFIMNHAIRIHTKDGKHYNIEPDTPKFKFGDTFDYKAAYFRTRMWTSIKSRVKAFEF